MTITEFRDLERGDAMQCPIGIKFVYEKYNNKKDIVDLLDEWANEVSFTRRHVLKTFSILNNKEK